EFLFAVDNDIPELNRRAPTKIHGGTRSQIDCRSSRLDSQLPSLMSRLRGQLLMLVLVVQFHEQRKPVIRRVDIVLVGFQAGNNIRSRSCNARDAYLNAI